MKRRNFIQNSAVGVVGFNLAGQSISSSLFDTSAVNEWFAKLVLLTSARKHSGLFLPDTLSERIGIVSDYYRLQGFKAKGAHVYYYGENQYCFFPMEKKHKASGMCDMVIPVLSEINQEWKQIATINGYQLEALVHAGAALSHPEMELSQLLLPAKNKNSRFCHGFTTAAGGIHIVTMISLDNVTKTTVDIHSGNDTIHHSSFISGHCMTCNGIEA